MSVTKVTAKERRDWRPGFLTTFRQTGNVLLSCHAAGISRKTAYQTRQRNPAFAAEWAAAEEDATEALEAEARRRAMSTSDTLLIFLLKARRPAVYRENARVELRHIRHPYARPRVTVRGKFGMASAAASGAAPSKPFARARA